MISAVLYRNGKHPLKRREFPSRDAFDTFLAEQQRVMRHAGWRVEGGSDFLNLYPPADSLSDGTWMTWTLVQP